jgi:hypothetical protein
MESIMIRSTSSGGFIAEKEDMLMNPQPWADSSLARFPDYLEVIPVGPARRVRATARFRWHRQGLESRPAFAADGRGTLFLSTLGAVARGVESRIRIVGIFGAGNSISQRWHDAG